MAAGNPGPAPQRLTGGQTRFLSSLTDVRTHRRAPAQTRTLTDQPGVYLWKDAEGNVLYVGKAKRLRSRVRSYFAADHSASLKHQYLLRHIADVETIVTSNEAQSLLLENNLIKEYQPQIQRPSQGRQELSIHRRHPGRAVPPRAGHPPAGHSRRPLFRTVHRRGAAAEDPRDRPPPLHRAQLRRRPSAGAARSALSRLPHRPLPGALCRLAGVRRTTGR